MRSEIIISDNFIVCYSGGSGDQRADQYMLNYLIFCKSQEENVCNVFVTEDQELRESARIEGAYSIYPQMLFYILNHSETH